MWCWPKSAVSVRSVLVGHHLRRHPHRGWSPPRSEPGGRWRPGCPRQAPARQRHPQRSVSGWGSGRRRVPAHPARCHVPRRPRGLPVGGPPSLVFVPYPHGSALVVSVIRPDSCRSRRHRRALRRHGDPVAAGLGCCGVRCASHRPSHYVLPCRWSWARPPPPRVIPMRQSCCGLR
jgi:hypothetical protein